MRVFISLLLVLYFSIPCTCAAVGGCIRGDCADGQGTYTYADGSTYVGQWKDNMRNGRGTYTRRDGSEYEGQWKNDGFHGQGAYTYADGSTYVGQWKDSMRNGRGTYTRRDGSKYEGQWKNDKLIGEGILITSDGNRLAGKFDEKGKFTVSLAEMLSRKIAKKLERPKWGEALMTREKEEPPVPETAEAEIEERPTEAEVPEAVEEVEVPEAVEEVEEPEAVEKAEVSIQEPAEVPTAEEPEKMEEPSERKKVEPELPVPETAALEKRKEPEAAPSKETFAGPSGMIFVYISPGTFMMGSPEDGPGRYDNETQHQVTLSQGFYMQTTEVTQGQWKVVMGDKPSYFNRCGDDCPVEQVSWKDVHQFIWRLNQLEGADKYRLPTEAEWEYACRAGSTTAFSSGGITDLECGHDPNLDAVGWFCGNSGKKTRPVGRKNPNAWGLYDMHGNVSEFCQDWYGEYPPDEVTDPTGPASGLDRVVRGGGVDTQARHCRAGCRGALSTDAMGYDVGFRLARTP